MGFEPGTQPPTTPPPLLRVASLNISLVAKEAIGGVCTYLINHSEADVIAIQGLNQMWYEPVFRAFKSSGYNYTKPDPVPERKDMEVLFSKLPIIKRVYRMFVQTSQLRGVMSYQVKVGATNMVWVCTSQLESGGSGNGPRKHQVAEIPKLFPKGESVIFAGDTNIPSWQSVDLPEGWSDAWREKGSVDTEKTTMEDRKDRIYYSPGVRCMSFDVVCKSEPRRGVVGSFVVMG